MGFQEYLKIYSIVCHLAVYIAIHCFNSYLKMHIPYDDYQVYYLWQKSLITV